MMLHSSDPAMPGTTIGGLQPVGAVDHQPKVTGTETVQAGPPIPDYVIPLAALTAAFVVVALAFAGRLLDAIGNPISERQLTDLAAWGWGLTGIALTLLVWGSFILPRAYHSGWPLWQTGMAILLSAIICCETTYLAGPGLAEDLTDKMSAEELRCAVQFRVLAATRQEDAVTVVPIGIRSALARAPSVGLSCDRLPEVSRDGLGEALQGVAAHQIGTAEQAYDAIFIPSVRSLRDAYNEYVVAQLRLVAGILDIRGQQARAWQRYLDRLAHEGLSPTHVRRRDIPRIVAEVRAMGVQVPPGWKPTDQATFIAAVATASRQSADAEYNDFIAQRFQEALPPGLGWDDFYSQPGIQARWSAAIGAPAEVQLTPNMGFSAFRQAVYQPIVDRLVQPQLNVLSDSSATFAPSGRQSPAGHAAAYWALVPALLLGVAMLCILWHAVRLVDLTWRILLPRMATSKRWAAQACLAAIVILALAFLHRAGGIQTASATQDAGACFSPDGGCNAGCGVGVLRAIGSGIRNIVLVGFDFGYNPALASDLTETALEPLLPPVQPRL
jgi:hypothetical protein